MLLLLRFFAAHTRYFRYYFFLPLLLRLRFRR